MPKNNEARRIAAVADASGQAALAAEVRRLRRENATLSGQSGDWKRLAQEFAAAAPTLPMPRKLRASGTPKLERMDAVLLLGDCHANERWTQAQTDGLTQYDFGRFCSSLWVLCRDVIRKIEELRPLYGLSTLHLDLMGDITHGKLRLDDEVTNEFATVPAVAQTSWVLYQAVLLLLEHFEHIEIKCVAGNHGRLHDKPQSKRHVEENLDTLIYCWLASLLGVRGLSPGRVGITIPGSRLYTFRRLGHKVLLAHGDHVRGGNSIAGLPIYGLSRDILRNLSRQVKAAREKEGLAIIEFGHFHQSNLLEDLMFINGAMCPTGPWAMDEMGAFAEPKQWLYLTSERRAYSWTLPLSLKGATEVPHGFGAVPDDIVPATMG